MWATAKVHPKHHPQAHQALHSRPTRCIGRTVPVRSPGKRLRVYLGHGQIKLHPR